MMSMFGSLLSISSMSWFTSWMGLEMNLLTIIPLMKTKNIWYSSESTIKYFIIQSISSMILIFSISSIMNLKIIDNPILPCLLISSCFLMKMGAAPFHFWLPEISNGFKWPILFFILTWQKLAPSMLLMYFNYYFTLMIITIILSSIIGSVQGLNQVCLRKLLAYSSINHMSWMISSLVSSYKLWMIYFIIYSLSNLFIIFILNKFNIYFLNKMMNIFPQNKFMKLLFMMNFLSLGGLPPFIGFLPKWLLINSMIFNGLYWLTFFIIIFNIISLFYYLRITFSSLMFNSSNLQTYTSESYFLLYSFLNHLFILSLPLWLIISNFYI
uniref:NADH-ubiquinone oxidoreductase chain 2 n=1 Tax=Phloeotribus sp. BMNH 1047247 TaxID=1903799 RepID=A0A343A5H0_9CUCU|nr:NADH dehydrogenase subunit 2 [Phloeotribus sp. BMNH 1047247]